VGSAVVHRSSSGKCGTYTSFTLEGAVGTQVQRESSVCDRRRRVVLNISQTTVHKQTDVFAGTIYVFAFVY